MGLIHLIGLLIVIGIVLALVPIDAQVRRWVLVLLAILVVFVLLRMVGFWPF